MSESSPRITVVTASNPGAVAVVQVYGIGTVDLLAKITGRSNWTAERTAGRLRLCDFADIDRGLVVLLRGGDDDNEDGWAQLMPHGGVRVVDKLVDRLLELGGVYEPQPPARKLYPEAQSDLEADMLVTIARAASSAAIDLLLAQPRLWRDYIRQPDSAESVDAIAARSRTLQHLIDPPAVVVVGRPNVGKSTLTNRMLGRSVSLVADLPGTTRDWVAGLAEIVGLPRVPCPASRVGEGVPSSKFQVHSGNDHPDPHPPRPETRNPKPETRPLAPVAVRWLDTPGLRDSEDVIEQQAIELARQAIELADVLIALRDPAHDWPDESALPRRPDLWALNKCDTLTLDTIIDGDGSHPDSPLPISAATGAGIDRLQQRILEVLHLAGVDEPGLWAFSPTLRRVCAGEVVDLRAYVGIMSSGGNP